MARALARLKPVEMPRLVKKPGMHCDGHGLYLRVAPPSSASWVLRYMIDGRARSMGLGPYPEIKLTEARERALQARKLKVDGNDPIEVRRLERAEKRLAAAKTLTFKECATAYIKSHREGWKSEKHAAQWVSTFVTYAYPLIGDLPVDSIDTGLVVQVLEQQVSAKGKLGRLWIIKAETASRVRGRMEAVLGWAAARGLRPVENPARWQGQLSHHLPARSKVSKVEHHAALPYSDIAAFMQRLREQPGIAAKALEFTILTAVRTNEALGARWEEFDLANNLWVIPAERMKAKREHRVPLSIGAASVLSTLKPDEDGASASPYVFAGAKPGKPLSNMAMLALLKRMSRADITIHGFRSTFRDWTAECTNHSAEIAEMALAHSVKDKVEAAYRRGDLLAKRAALMDDWYQHCFAQKPSEVSPSEVETVLPTDHKIDVYSLSI